MIIGRGEKTVAVSKMGFLMLVIYCGSAFKREEGEGAKDRKQKKVRHKSALRPDQI